jgi:hypothetical protein
MLYITVQTVVDAPACFDEIRSFGRSPSVDERELRSIIQPTVTQHTDYITIIKTTATG